jgi:hypothetical protein
MLALKLKSMKLNSKKTFTHKSDLFRQEATLVVNDELNKLKGKVLAPKKLAAANHSLKRLKNRLPK